MMESILPWALFFLLAFSAILIATSTNLFIATLLASSASLLVASIFATLNAPDVALTEAAVSAGASTLFFLGVLTKTGNFHSYQKKNATAAFCIAAVFATLLIYASVGLPPYGDASAVANAHLAKYYLDHTPQDIGVPNVVTSVLASYRGFDTLGELLMVFTACIATIGMGSLRPKRNKS